MTEPESVGKRIARKWIAPPEGHEEVGAKEREELAGLIDRELEAERNYYALLRGICEDVIDWRLMMIEKHPDLADDPENKELRSKLDAMYKHPLDDGLLARTDKLEAERQAVDELLVAAEDTSSAFGRYHANQTDYAGLRDTAYALRECAARLRKLRGE